jgi:phosphatidylglycerophosphate synthase
MINIAKAEKLPREHRYFNISVLWIPYYRWALRLFYALRIPHEVVTALSIIAGLASAWWFYQGQLLVAAIAFHFKDVFDACDGALARLTGRGHLIGRYLDSLGDFLVITAVLGAITLRAAEVSTAYWFWGGLAVVSTFLQCSLFNYYQLAYLERFGIDRLISRQDERGRSELKRTEGSTAGRMIVRGLNRLYLIVYGWQDRLVAAVDNHLRKRNPGVNDQIWYGHRKLMTAQSALCFGTHIFVVIIAALVGRPAWALPFIVVAMNLYLLILLGVRYRLEAVTRLAGETV